jgi:hypothetical protein
MLSRGAALAILPRGLCAGFSLVSMGDNVYVPNLATSSKPYARI